MNFEYSDEQRMLADTVARFVNDRHDFQDRLRTMEEPLGWSRQLWREMAEMGLLGLPFAEADGGFGGNGADTMIVMEQLGRGLALEPYFTTVILAGGIIRAAASDAQRTGLVPAIAAGEMLVALAHQEPHRHRHTLSADTCAKRTATGWVLEGAKIDVLHGPSADRFIVSAMTEEGLSLFIVPAQALGLAVKARRLFDRTPVADLTLQAIEVPEEAIIGERGDASRTLRSATEEANAALCAEAVGLMGDTLDLTVSYLQTRKQFGVPIGSFQGLQHRVAEMLIQLELARSMAILAGLSLDQPEEQRRRNIAAAKVQISRSGRFIGQQSIQLHGAIGLTAEYKVGHAFRRLTAIETLGGDADHHLDFLEEVGGLMVTA